MNLIHMNNFLAAFEAQIEELARHEYKYASSDRSILIDTRFWPAVLEVSLPE